MSTDEATRPVATGWSAHLVAPVSWLAAQLSAERDRWPLWLPVAFGTGIGLYFALPVEPAAWLGAGLLALCLAIAVVVRRSGSALPLAIGLAVLAAGFSAAQLRTALVAAPVLQKKLGPAAVSGRVVSGSPQALGGRVLLEHPVLPGLAPEDTPARVRVRLTSRDGLSPAPGDWIRVRAVLRPPPGPAMPGAFDFARQAYFARLGGVGYAVGRARAIDPPPGVGESPWRGPLKAWDGWWAGLRHGVAARVLAAVPDERGAVAAALMTGQRGAIPEPVIQAMRDSGLAHLLAISGLHMGLVAGLLFFGLRAVLAAMPAVALRHPIKKWAAVAAALGAFCYLFLVGATVPSQRAFLMVGVVLLAVVLDRTAVSLRLVAWAAFAVLLFAPESLLSASFQMSFGAVTALVAGYEALARRRHAKAREPRGLPTRLGLYVLGVALTSVIAILATAPFAVFHFNRMAWYGLAANLVAVPLTGFWIMPWAILAFLLMPLGLEGLALQPMAKGIGAVIGTAETIAGLPGAVSAVPAMPLWGLLLVVAGGLWLCLWQRPWRAAGLAAIVMGGLGLATVRPPDILVSGDAKLFALRGPGGALWLSSPRATGFTAETWLRRAGLSEGRSWPRPGAALGGALRCDAVGCLFRGKGSTVAFALGGEALDEDCRIARVVISVEPVPPWRCGAPDLVIDRFDLWRHGAHALWLGEKDIRVATSAERRGARPWVPERGRRAAQ